jgi:selenide,water dikinase
MHPLAGVRISLVSSEGATAYSGMIPGRIAGHYTFDEAHIDLRKICRFANASFIHAAVTGLDLQNRRILFPDRPPLGFDIVSINTGSTPRMRNIPGATDHALPVKPLGNFLRGWESIVQGLSSQSASPTRIVIVGGGAGGVELVLTLQHSLRHLTNDGSETRACAEFHLVTDSASVLPTHNRRVQGIFTRLLARRGIRVHLDHRVVAVKPGLLDCAAGGSIPYDRLIWTTDAEAPEWIHAAGLQTDPGGFLAVHATLQSISHPFVFGAGDVAAVLDQPRPKSGVFAVRQGPPLARNLRRALAGESLKPFIPQRRFLSLISTGDKYAIASRGPWAVEGAWVWRWKNGIDRRWMRQYQQLPFEEKQSAVAGRPPFVDLETWQNLSGIRCGGCGAKIGSRILTRALARLNVPAPREDVLIGLESPDDAAVIVAPPGMALVQTVDFFRALMSDPYLFGRIAATHALGDIFAMGGRPQSALALVMLPVALEARMEEQLYQLLAGASAVLTENAAVLAGGHTAEGLELVFGLAATGFVDPRRMFRKGGLKPGDQLILTKPLGTGALFAAEMRLAARGTWLEGAIASMLRSNRTAADCFSRHQATACTDVTGFGLLGHLLEMLRASPGVSAELFLPALPLLDGVQETFRAGIFSSLQGENSRSRNAIMNLDKAARAERFPVLFDPQTSGGLLAGVPARAARLCIDELHRDGCGDAAIIGAVVEGNSGETRVKVML